MSPIYYEPYYMNGSFLDTYVPPNTGNPANYRIPYIAVSYNAAGTSATLTIAPSTSTPGSYSGAATSYTFNDPDFVINTNTNTYTITGMTPGVTYSLRIRAWTGANQSGSYGDYYYDKLTPPKPSSVLGVTATSSATQTPPDTEFDDVMTRAKLNQLAAAQKAALANSTLETDGTEDGVDVMAPVATGTAFATSGNRTVQTSLFKIDNNSVDKNHYSIATKSTNISTSYTNYAFGTSLFFPPLQENVSGSGGIAFFTSNNGLTGYYILVQSTSNLSDTADKEIKIIKLVNGRKLVLNDSQGSSAKTQLTGILGGQLYKLDINVSVSSGQRKIEVYVNNYKITATDTTDASSKDDIKKVLPVTSNIALFSASGSTSFDYVYAAPITEAQYTDGALQNVYEGKYGVKTLSFLFGDKIVSNKTIAPAQLPFMEEFGTVARELKKIKVKYEARPGNPLYTSTGINQYVNILGQRLTSFGAEVYVINNSGTFIPLDDSNLYSFSIIGNYIVVSGQHEYVSNTLSENTIPEPVIFESSWIQLESDAKNLTTWIQEQWSKKQQVVEMEIFSNPLISVGDIVGINYAKNGLDGTQKFVITKVNNSFGEGLSTSITARSIYS
jgi:hypothetical protein